ncbi:MAG TPA: hypothetical protein VEL79_09455 [Vicinamibacterales bacterium]|nr:hypothetical protein [Vicinamibacterales bacterium]
MIFALLLILQSPAQSCATVPDCRAQALAAAAQGDFERFHDLIWRAVQKGRPNDPELMYLLARAQALSGRPDDALVMLGRIADLGVATDAATNEDFARVRLLQNWPTLAARLAALSSSAPSATARSAPAPSPLFPPAPLAPSAPTPETLSFVPTISDPIGLAHDAVSRRFVLGDRATGRLLIVDEISRHVVNYVSAASAGFYDDITAFTIDARRGDLWVVSTKETGDAATSVLHKLQLVSGRTLLEVPLPEASRPARFAAVTVTDEGTVYVLDAVGARLFRLRPGARTLETVMHLGIKAPATLTHADDRILYIANDAGVIRIDLETRAAKPVTSAEHLTGFGALAWHAGSLIGIEGLEEKTAIVRVKLDAAGTRVLGREILVTSPHGTAGVLAGSSYYYLAEAGAIRRLDLR